MVRIDPTWYEVLRPQFEADYFQQLKAFLVAERQQYICYPKGGDIFAAFDRTPFDRVRVVILGQDPYHEPGQAHGLCFSVPDGVPVPPSLVNIIKEINSDLGVNLPLTNGNLTGWAAQGVLLLNATLTVRAHQAGSHQRHGWELFTDAAIRALSERRQGLVFLLWAAMPSARPSSSTAAAIWCSPPRTRRPSRPTAAFSAAATSPNATPTSSSRDCRPSTGPPRASTEGGRRTLFSLHRTPPNFRFSGFPEAKMQLLHGRFMRKYTFRYHGVAFFLAK